MESEQPTNFPSLINYIDRLENRIKRLEEHLKLEPLVFGASSPPVANGKKYKESKDIEMQIGQFWLAKVGVIALLTGIVFILTLPFDGLSQIIPLMIGYLIAAALAGLSVLFKKSFEVLSQYLMGGALIVLYVSTLRLYYFSADPLLTDKTIVIALALLVISFNFFISIRRNSIYLTGTILALAFLTAMLIETALIEFILILALAIFTAFLKEKYSWRTLLTYGLIITYFTHFLWFINNPLAGNPIKITTGISINLPFILLYFLVFTYSNYLSIKKEKENNLISLNILLNCLSAFGLFFIISLLSAKESLFQYHLIMSILFIALSYIFWVKFRSKFSSFFYSITGFTALSVAIIAGVEQPDFFIILCWQSLLVLAFALLYKSKFITVANFIMYLLIFIVYLGFSGFGNITISFGIVALLSARITNWQKNRLEIRTEFIRHTYLFLAFIIFPIALFNMVPNEYVSIAWIILSVIYYAIGMLLNNIKYRWLALYTLLITAVYLLVIGIQESDPTYRIISFLSLGLVLLLVSLVYSRARLKRPIESLKK